jgi:hypothetical protein
LGCGLIVLCADDETHIFVAEHRIVRDVETVDADDAF